MRKASEYELKRILPENLRVADAESGRTLSLNALIQNYNEFSRKHKDFPKIVASFTDDRKLLMNPFSHDDMHCQAYRMEIETLISQLKDLEEVKAKVIVDYDNVRSGIFKMEMTNNGHTKKVEFVFSERFSVMSYKGTNYLGDPRVKIIASDAHRINPGNEYVLNKVHTKLAISVSLNNTTAPEILDCTTKVATGEVLRNWL